MKPNYLLHFLESLRFENRVLLYNSIPEIPKADIEDSVNFLKSEYEKEKLEFPNSAPDFNPNAASFSAISMYLLAQYLLYRNAEVDKMNDCFPVYSQLMDASSILSADLVFRFLPQFHIELLSINYEDELLLKVVDLMKVWHYSCIQSIKDSDYLEQITWYDSDCYRQLYVERIIVFKNQHLAVHSILEPMVKGHLGLYKTNYWKNLIYNE